MYDYMMNEEETYYKDQEYFNCNKCVLDSLKEKEKGRDEIFNECDYSYNIINSLLYDLKEKNIIEFCPLYYRYKLVKTNSSK